MIDFSIKNEFRGLPFWSWNGKLSKDEIIRQVHILKDMGFGGFFMHSRTGLETEYLGEEWFDCIKAASLEAQKLGMTAWIYDEDRWPSGSAGGIVTKNRQFQQKCISLYEIDENEVENYTNNPDLLGLFAVELFEGKIAQYCHYKAPLKKGFKVFAFICEYQKPQDFYNGFTYLDTLNIDATKAYLDSTHEKYKEICGDLLGTQIIGIFTDEPHRGSILNGFGLNNDNKLNMMPYTYLLFELFEKLWGYALKDRLPELYYLCTDSNINLVMSHYIETLQQMFINNFAIPYQKWCKDNKLILTGHVLHEDNLAIQTIFQGSVQRYYEHMDYPGVDILTEGNRSYWVAKQVHSVARQFNKPFVLSELYGCTGWQMNFKSHLDVGLWQALLGINLRCHHLSWYTMKGEAKRDYPASIFYQSGWYKDYKYIEDYFARLHSVLNEGQSYYDTLVINPVESVWLYPRKGWQKNYFETQFSEINEIEKKYFELFHILTTSQVDFDYGDEDIIRRHGKIVEKEGKFYIQVGQACYAKIVVSGMDTIRSTTVNILKEFAQKGGLVIAAGEKPFLKDGILDSKALNDVKLVETELNKESLLPLLKKDCCFTLDSESIISAAREVSNGFYLVLLNTNRTDYCKGLTLKMASTFNVAEINLFELETRLLLNNTTSLNLDFAPGECKVLYLTKNELNLLPKTILKSKSILPLAKPLNYTLSEDNLLPLDMPLCNSASMNIDKPTEILKLDRILREKMALPLRGGEMLQPWFKKKHGIGEKENSMDISLTYHFNVSVIPQKPIFLIMEQSNLYNIYLNGQAIAKKEAIFWVDTCFDKIQLDNTYLKNGLNNLVLKASFDDRLNLECCYLSGDFGVKEGAINEIIALPQKLSVGDVTPQGLPFYSGSISYFTGISNKKVNVKLQECYGAFTKAKDDTQEKMIVRAPYESGVMNLKGELVLETVLTRRNTFGPLHLKGKYLAAYGPDAFTADSLYGDEYSLIEQGILQAPIIEILE